MNKIKKQKMNISLILFLIGILGFILNRKNIILMIIAIEIMLLSVTLLVLIMSYGFDDNIGQTFSIYIISIAGAESVIGLSILVAYYRLFTPIISNCLFNNNTSHIVAPLLVAIILQEGALHSATRSPFLECSFLLLCREIWSSLILLLQSKEYYGPRVLCALLSKHFSFPRVLWDGEERAL